MALVVMLLTTQSSAGQSTSYWTDSGSHIYNTNSGNVGIGTSNPEANLHVGDGSANGEVRVDGANAKLRFLAHATYGNTYIQSGTAWSSNSTADLYFTGMYGNPKYMIIKANGIVGIGTATPVQERLHVYDPNGSTGIFLGGNSTGGPHGIIFDDDTPGDGVQLVWRTSSNQLIIEKTSAGTASNGTDAFWYDRDTDHFYFSGNVGIGTTVPSHELSVNGTIRAKEIIVDTGWSDFVFDGDYDLPTLEQVQQHINTHGHLPDVPSAEQVAANGVSLGEMDATLLQKIEELTLYTIAQEEEIQSQEERLESQEEQIELQEEQITQLLQAVAAQQAQIEDLQASLHTLESK